MKIIISPAKKMNIDTDTYPAAGFPQFLEDAEKLLHWMRKLDYPSAKALWRCNDQIASLNFERYQNMQLRKNLTPAVLSYEGIQYRYMAPSVFTDQEFAYVQEHVRILSGFYGVLRPLDGVTPYRLEMQARAAVAETKDLYEYWGRRLYEAVMDQDRVVVNLASKEYSRCIESYLRPGDRFLTCVFGELKDGKVIQKGTMAKMARGEMVRYMAGRQIGAEGTGDRAGEDRVKEQTETEAAPDKGIAACGSGILDAELEKLKEFTELGYCYHEELSSQDTYVFIRNVD